MRLAPGRRQERVHSFPVLRGSSWNRCYQTLFYSRWCCGKK